MPKSSQVAATALSFWLPIGAATYLTPNRPTCKMLSMKGTKQLARRSLGISGSRGSVRRTFASFYNYPRDMPQSLGRNEKTHRRHRWKQRLRSDLSSTALFHFPRTGWGQLQNSFHNLASQYQILGSGRCIVYQ